MNCNNTPILNPVSTPVNHFSGVLYLMKRGCDFLPNDTRTRESDLGNYRLFLEFIDQNGVRVCGDVLRGTIREYSPKGKEQIVTENGIHCDFCYEDHKGCFRYRVPDHDELRYTRADVLKLVNRLSAARYERVEIVRELPDYARIYPEAVLELERAYLAREHDALFCECEALIRENYSRWMNGAPRSDLARLTADEYRDLTLAAFEGMVDDCGYIEEKGETPAHWMAHRMTKHFFEEQRYVDPYGDMAFLNHLHALCPYYVGRYMRNLPALTPEQFAEQYAR